MNFGSSGSEGSGQSQAQTVETELSKEQASLLKERRAQFNQHIFPEIVEELEEADLQTVDQPTLRAGVEATNRAADQAQQQLTSNVAQRGLEGSGAELQAQAALSSSRASALSQDYFNAQNAAKQNKMNLLQLGSGLAPSTTTAAPMGQQSGSSQSQTSRQSGLGTLGVAGFGDFGNTF